MKIASNFYIILIMQEKNNKKISTLYLALAGISIGLGGYALYQYFKNDNCIKLSSFFQALGDNQINEVKIIRNNLYFKSEESNWYYTCIAKYPIQLLFSKLSKAPNISYSTEEENPIILNILAFLGSMSSVLLAAKLATRSVFSSSSKYPKIVDNQQKFQDFYGSDQIKQKLKEIILYLKDQQKLKKLGGRLRKGILFHGPPGTGKTMLAKTLANQSNLPFISTCASEFEQIYVGVGPKKIRQIFQKAKSCKQGCIIFIDELDAIGNRSERMRSSKETTATINQLLTELDGFQTTNKIVVIGATNRLDLVDQALIRAGRFDLKIRLDLPNELQRKGILQTLLKKKKVPHQISEWTIQQICEKSKGWNGADIQTLINQAIFKAIREKNQIIKDSHIKNAFYQMKQV